MDVSVHSALAFIPFDRIAVDWIRLQMFVDWIRLQMFSQEM